MMISRVGSRLAARGRFTKPVDRIYGGKDSYSSGPATAGTVITKLTGGFYQGDVSPSRIIAPPIGITAELADHLVYRLLMEL